MPDIETIDEMWERIEQMEDGFRIEGYVFNLIETYERTGRARRQMSDGTVWELVVTGQEDDEICVVSVWEHETERVLGIFHPTAAILRAFHTFVNV